MGRVGVSRMRIVREFCGKLARAVLTVVSRVESEGSVR